MHAGPVPDGHIAVSGNDKDRGSRCGRKAEKEDAEMERHEFELMGCTASSGNIQNTIMSGV